MKNFSFLNSMLFALTMVLSIQTMSSQNYGVQIKSASSFGDKFQLRFDDKILGEHTNGQTYDPGSDKRSRSFTLSAWFKTDESKGSLPYKKVQILGYGEADYYGRPGSVNVNLEDGKFKLHCKAWDGSTSYQDLNGIDSGLACESGIWYFVSVVADDVAKKVYLYVDGELKATANTAKSNSGEDMQGTALLSDKCVFYFNNGVGMNMKTDYDELQLWNKALTTDEIKASMKGYVKAPEGLVGYYTLDNRSGDYTYPNEGNNTIDCPAIIVSAYLSGFDDIYAAYANAQIVKEDFRVEGCDRVDKEEPLNYIVMLEQEGEGTVKLLDEENTEYSADTEFKENTVLSVKAIPANSWQLDSILINDMKLNLDDPKFTVTEVTTVRAFFSLMKGHIAVDDGTLTAGGKYICIDPATQEEYTVVSGESGSYYDVSYGEKVKVSVRTNKGYSFAGVEVKDAEDHTVELADSIFTVASTNYTIVLNFDRLYKVMVEKAGEGAIVFVDKGNKEYTGGEEVKEGTELTVKAIPATDYQLDSIKINGTNIDLSAPKFTVGENVTARVVFSLMKARIAVDSGMAEGGKYICIDPETNEEYEQLSSEGGDFYYEIPYRSKVKVKVEENKNYVLAKMEIKDAQNKIIEWDVDQILTIASPKYTIVLSFDKLYMITYQVTEGGALTVKDGKTGAEIETGTQVVEGTKIVITSVANEGYELENLEINGERVGMVQNSYSIIVDEDMDIVANFRYVHVIKEITVKGITGERIARYAATEETLYIDKEVEGITIYTSQGNNILFSRENKVNVSALPAGNYIVRMQIGSNFYTLKFCKNK